MFSKCPLRKGSSAKHVQSSRCPTSKCSSAKCPILKYGKPTLSFTDPKDGSVKLQRISKAPSKTITGRSTRMPFKLLLRLRKSSGEDLPDLYAAITKDQAESGLKFLTDVILHNPFVRQPVEVETAPVVETVEVETTVIKTAAQIAARKIAALEEKQLASQVTYSTAAEWLHKALADAEVTNHIKWTANLPLSYIRDTISTGEAATIETIFSNAFNKNIDSLSVDAFTQMVDMYIRKLYFSQSSSVRGVRLATADADADASTAAAISFENTPADILNMVHTRFSEVLSKAVANKVAEDYIKVMTGRVELLQAAVSVETFGRFVQIVDLMKMPQTTPEETAIGKTVFVFMTLLFPETTNPAPTEDDLNPAKKHDEASTQRVANDPMLKVKSSESRPFLTFLSARSRRDNYLRNLVLEGRTRTKVMTGWIESAIKRSPSSTPSA